jgi:hypothetical protein
MRAAFESVASAAKNHRKAMGVGGVHQDFEFQSWLLRLDVRYLTEGSDVGYTQHRPRRREAVARVEVIGSPAVSPHF